MPKIVTLTLNPAVDKSCPVEQVVAERKLRCGEPAHHPGGGINVSRAIQKLGGESSVLWTCGGAIGELLRQLLDGENLRHDPIAIGEMTRENLIVFEESSGQQFRFGMPGATLTETDVQTCLDRLQAIDPPPDYLVLSGSLPPGVDENFYARLVHAALLPGRARYQRTALTAIGIYTSHNPLANNTLQADSCK